MNKPLILGLDLASVSGWALWDTARHRSSIECGIIESPDFGKNRDGKKVQVSPEYKAAQFGLKLTELIRAAKARYGRKIDWVVVEEAAATSLGGIKSTIVSSMIHGAAYGTVANHGIGWGTVNVKSWRSVFFKGAYVPQKKGEVTAWKLIEGKKVKTKEKGLVDDWKAAAVLSCEDQGISLPAVSKDKQHNAAEAVCLAIMWEMSKCHAGRHRDRFHALRTGKAA
jgi:hypothetical protein